MECEEMTRNDPPSSARAALGAALERRIALMAPARRLRFALTLRRLERLADSRPIRVLDAGCGDGLLSIAIARRHPGWGVVGYDHNIELLAYARGRAREASLNNVRFEQADLTRPLPESGFDAVTAIEILEEIYDDHAAISQLAAAAKPGGLLIVHVPEKSWKPVLRGSDPTWRDEVRHGYTHAELETLLRAAGLNQIEIEPTFRNTVALAQEIRDRIKDRSPAVRALAFPAMAAAARLEWASVTWGPARALIATASVG